MSGYHPDWRKLFRNPVRETHAMLFTPYQQKTDNESALRHLLQKWIDRDEARHPDFQDKELIQESKELINKSRQ